MNLAYLIAGISCFILSFVIHQYYIQFIVVAVFLMVLYIVNKNSRDIESLKKVITEYNELLKKEVERKEQQ